MLLIFGLPNEVEAYRLDDGGVTAEVEVPYTGYASRIAGTQSNLDMITVHLDHLMTQMELDASAFVSTDTVRTHVANDERIEGLMCLQWT